MSAEPGAAADAEDQPATKRFVSSMIKLSEMRLRDELKPILPLSEQAISSKIESAIRSLKSDLEREHEQQDRDKYYKQSELWLNRIVAAAVAFVISIVFTTTFSQCSELHSRITTLELKKCPPLPPNTNS